MGMGSSKMKEIIIFGLGFLALTYYMNKSGRVDYSGGQSVGNDGPITYSGWNYDYFGGTASSNEVFALGGTDNQGTFSLQVPTISPTAPRVSNVK